MPDNWKKPRRFDRNLVVIGGGAAGLVSAYIAAMVRAKVTLVEAHQMGGDCLNTGCVPSKALLKSAKVAHAVRDGVRFGVDAGEIAVDFPQVMRRLRDVIATIEPHDSIERYTALGVECAQGYARFVDPWTVEIERADGTSTRLTSKAFIIATGAEPVIPAIPGIEASGFLTSETLWDAMASRAKAPEKLVILGGGPIGCELAQAIQRLGSQVTLVEMADRLLLKEEADAASVLTAALTADGVRVLTGHKAVRFEGTALIAEGSDGEVRIDFDDIIIAVGRRARISGFGLEELGLVDNGKVAVDAYLRTRLPHIFVAGDVAGNQQLTHGAAHEAWYASVNALARPFRRYRADYRFLPRVTYTDPEVASVGLSEDSARAQSVSFEVTRYNLDDFDRAIADGETEGFVKILTQSGNDKLLGVTIVAPHAGEMIAEWVLAMRQGLRLRHVMQAIHSYPTWSEANKMAAGRYGLARQPERLQRLAKRWFDWVRG
ncbi:dihydrolipoyl dehydrogenase family protein [Sphingorhabdus sp.]|uniref:dihydrolipoyl dehydrogenase family protein n=1 Tax=Sphingorhabdus sp. TaxID=1902408 RepID=UPI003BB0EBD2